MKTEIDEHFISRVYRTSAFVWAFGLSLCLIFWWPRAAVGWTLGSAMSVGVLRSLEVVVRLSFVPGAVGAKGALARLSVAKLFVIGMILSAIVLLGGRSFEVIGAFCAGVLLTQAVIFLKALGMLVCGHLSREQGR